MIKRLSLRINVDKLEHKRALNILTALPQGRMNEYIIHAIIRAYNQDEFKSLIAETMIEVMENYDLSKLKAKTPSNGSIDSDVMDFLDTL